MLLLSFRFDVDTHLCASEGVPNLLDLAKSRGVRFTFFFNMGRGTSRALAIKRLMTGARRNRPQRCAAPTPLQKLGHRGYLETVFLNPYVGRANRDVVVRAIAEGHEVGLHGGSNHATWQYGASQWGQATIERELELGLGWLYDCGGHKPTSFSSPDWNGPEMLPRILEKHGFDLQADEHGHDLSEVTSSGRIRRVPTNVAGEPGGVGYIAHQYALGHDERSAADQFRAHLDRHDQFAVTYDHPLFAGRRGLPLFTAILDESLRYGAKIVTMSDIADLFGNSP